MINKINLLVKRTAWYILVPCSSLFLFAIITFVNLYFNIFFNIDSKLGRHKEVYESEEFEMLLLMVILIPIIETILIQILIIELIFKFIINHIKNINFFAGFCSALIFGSLHYFNITYFISSLIMGSVLSYMYLLFRVRKIKAFTVVFLIHSLFNLLGFSLRYIE